MKKSVAIRKADALFSTHIRSTGVCRAQGVRQMKCSTGLQCAHVRSRRYHSIRWSDDNAVCLCAAHHIYYTHHPLEWEQWCLDEGIDYDGLRYRGLHDPPMDPFEVLDRLETA